MLKVFFHQQVQFKTRRELESSGIKSAQVMEAEHSIVHEVNGQKSFIFRLVILGKSRSMKIEIRLKNI